MRSASAAAILLVLAAAGCGDGAGTSTEPSAPGPSEDGVVAYVNDGDTLRLRDGRRVRLLQIDAPELRGDCYGKAALATLRRLAPEGTRVTLARDPGLDARDRYGRLLRYVFASGRNLNLELVRQGAASPYFYRKERGRYAEALLDAVDEAHREQRGYWRACPSAKLNTGIGSVTGPA
jgi:endonuclease YncB( thermonuclease family)